MWSRRAFLKAGAVGMFSLTLGGTPTFLGRAALAATSKKPQTLVCIFQRGAMDGLMAVTPFNDPNLRTLRPRIAMSVGPGQLIDLDGRFGLHPGFAGLERFYREGRLAIVHGMGSPDNTRSHFDAQDYMETGTPGRKGTRSGWLNRAAGLMGHDHTPFSCVSLTSAMPRSLYGDFPALAVSDLASFGVQEAPASKVSAGQSLEALYNNTTQDLLKGAGQDSFQAVKQLSREAVRTYRPANGAVYPNGNLGQSLKQIAYLIKSGLGLEIAFTESAGWDTHVNQGTGQGTFFQRANELANSISAFWTDLGSTHQDHVCVMTMTEFGRTCGENGSGGTDHGRGSCMFVLGNRVKGRQVYGQVPTLARENLEDQRDLPVTTDFRAVFSEVAAKHLKVPASQTLFPGWNGTRLTLMS